MEFKNCILRACILLFVMLISLSFSPKLMATSRITNVYMTVGETSKLPKEARCKGYAYKISNNGLLQVSSKGKMYHLNGTAQIKMLLK